MSNITTQADIDLLRAAINSGERRVRHADRMVEYRDLDEMKRILADMEAAVAESNGNGRGRPNRVFTIRHDSGL